jgi:site-specific recombinase XerD
MAKANGIYERKGKSGDITYYVRYSYIYRDTEGNEKIKDVREKLGRKSRGFTREMAKEALKARLGEIAQGRFNLDKVRKPHAFGELVESYLKHAESYKASFNREKYAIEGLQKYFGSATHLSKITTWTVEKWKRERAKQVQPSTVNRELTILKHMLKMAVRWELASVNPASVVSPFPIQEGRIRFATEEELPKLIESCRNQATSPWLHPLVVLAMNTSARQGEILDLLREGDVDFERSLIYFGRTKNRKLKVIPMNRAAREAVEWFLQNSKGKYLVSWPWGDPVGKTTVYDAFNRACHEAEIQNLHFHDLRHTAASYMVMNGVDLPTVKEILGHSEINMTMRYSHLAPAHKAKAVQQLGDALEQIQQGPLDRQAEATTDAQTATNLAHFRHVLVVKSGRGLSVIGPKTQSNQQLNTDQNWWRRGESNPRPKVFRQI